ncbi:integrase core domain-containing protein [Streptococcus pneumoniae]|nr:integrase core domain-containing protein [Streptococcus pneumoniae]
MTEFSLVLLLKSIKLARWTYYYHLKQLDKTDKDQELKAEIQSIFIEHKGNYAYRRVHLELRNRAYLVNHKRVQGLIKVLNLQAKMRQKRKYSSHKGDVGLFSLLALTSHKWYYVRFGKRVMLLLYYLFAHNKRELFYENLLNMP